MLTTSALAVGATFWIALVTAFVKLGDVIVCFADETNAAGTSAFISKLKKAKPVKTLGCVH